ncbi:hypothetical protein HUG15_12500 [Salicibibacter cibarius]|uniref:Uncharacterized protein n=1 Tax=Salicibibacter cibarius TaxID=2743000 RepID=A0A7T7CBT6_9BACI|nr:hypothetical protein HUG15_12500 [Salicibibacter cibarius]
MDNDGFDTVFKGLRFKKPLVLVENVYPRKYNCSDLIYNDQTSYLSFFKTLHFRAQIMKYSAESAKLMIDNGWLEEPPQAKDRDRLAKKKHNNL